MCITEYNEQETMYAFKQEWKQETKNEDLKSIINILRKLIPDIETIYQTIIEDENFSDVSFEQIKKYYFDGKAEN